MSETEKIRDRAIVYCEGYGLDIGCGVSKIKTDAVGVDKVGYDGVSVVCDLNEGLSFDACIFDYVFSSHCLEHLEEVEAALCEWLRVLRVGGFLVLYLPHPSLYKEENPEHINVWSPEEVRMQVEALGGLVVEEFIDSGENRYSFFLAAKKVK